MTNLFDKSKVDATIDRIEKLDSSTHPKWEKMSVDQMLAHCNVAYDMTYTSIYPNPGFLKKLLLKMVVKKAVVGPKPYPKNGRTAPQFIITGQRDFEVEQNKLIAYISKIYKNGASFFEGKENLSFGVMTASEWNMLFAKHLDHHLGKFGV